MATGMSYNQGERDETQRAGDTWERSGVDAYGLHVAGATGMNAEAQEACECEHAAHFHDEGIPDARTPNGNPGHSYGVLFHRSYIQVVKTTGGTFTVCRDCATDCMVAVMEAK